MVVIAAVVIFVKCARNEVKPYTESEVVFGVANEDEEVLVDFDSENKIVTIRCGDDVTIIRDILDFTYGDPDGVAVDYYSDPVAVLVAKRDEDYADQYAIGQDGDIALMWTGSCKYFYPST